MTAKIDHVDERLTALRTNMSPAVIRALPVENLARLQMELDLIWQQVSAASNAPLTTSQQATMEFNILAVQEQLRCQWQAWLLWRQVTALALGTGPADHAYGAQGELVFVRTTGVVIA